MKLRLTKLHAALCLLMAHSTVFAASGELFSVSSSGTPGTLSITLCLNAKAQLSCQTYTTTALTLSILTVPNHNYVGAGIKINTPGYTPTGCTQLSNGYCSFAVSKTTPASVPVKVTNIYIKAGGACGTGNGTMQNPYTCLSDAETNSDWLTLNVLSSASALDGGITLVNAQNIVGACSSKASQQIQNSSSLTHNGDAIVATGNNTITGITIPTAVRIGINGQASNTLNVSCADITSTNTSQQTHTVVLTNGAGTVTYPYGAIDLLGNPNNGATNISDVNVSGVPFGIALSSSGSATRTYSVSATNVNYIGAGAPAAEIDGILVQAVGSSTQSGVITTCNIHTFTGGYNAQGYFSQQGIMFQTANNARLPSSEVSECTITNARQGIQTLPGAVASPVPEQYNFHDNSLPNMWNPIVVRNNPANYKSVVSITNNSMINDPSGFWNNSITMLFSGTADSGESTYTITNNVFNNTYGFPIGAGNYHQGGGTPPTLTIRATGNKMKNVGVPWGVVNEQPGSNYQVVNFLATNNCVQNSGLWAPFSGVNIGQMIFGDYGFGSSALTSNINVHQNYFLNPIQGNVGFGPIDLIVSAGWAADLASNYWADGCPNCVPRDFVGFGAGTITGSGTFLTTGPTTCNVPDYVPFALQGRKNKMSISKAQQIYEAPQPLWGRTLNQIPSWNGSSQKS